MFFPVAMYSYTIILLLLCGIMGMDLREEGSYCYTPEQKTGTCIRIQSCSFVQNLLSSPPNANYLFRLTCGFALNDPLVCCPHDSNTTERQATTVATVSAVTIAAATTVTTAATVVTPGASMVTAAVASAVDDFKQNTSRESKKHFVEDTFLRPPHCGLSNGLFKRVVAGSPAKRGQFPWMAALGYRNTDESVPTQWLCGGALISKKHVLTAAHCITETSKELYVVRLGDLNLNSDDDGATPSDILVKSTVIHENFSAAAFANDIAIITLSQEVDNPTVWPICLPVDEPLRSKDLIGYHPFIAGWGATEYEGPSSPMLRTTQLPVVDNARCARAYARYAGITIDDRVLCAGFERGGKDSCKGDSGGPLMYPTVETGDVRFYIVGVVSFGYKCAESGHPGIYTKVPVFIDWIQSKLQP